MTPPRPSPTKATPLRATMMRQMQLYRLSPGTQQLYVKAITDLVSRWGLRSGRHDGCTPSGFGDDGLLEHSNPPDVSR